MLAQFALVVFGLLAVLTLVIDLGLVTLTRVQMQNAADTAAIEGVRHRDAVADDGYASDCVRRLAVRDLVRWTLDDDFDATQETPETEPQFGVGPRMAFITKGIGDLDAGRQMALPDDGAPPVYKPDLQLNRDNAPHGDIVSGTFTGYDPLPLPDEAFDYSQPGHDALDPSLQTRDNFVPTVGVPGAGAAPCPEEVPLAWPASGAAPIADTALLVRLRRTGNVDGLDEIPDETLEGGSNGVSSNGGPLPLLFGRGALLASPNPDAGYSVRRDGLTVRSSAVAAALPALRVGPPQPGVPEGLAPFIITTAWARDLAAAATEVALAIDAAGQGLTPLSEELARFDLDAAALATLREVARPVPAPAGACMGPLAPADTAGYVPVYPADPGERGAGRIVGFVRARFIITPSGAADCSGTLTVWPLRQAVARTKASAILPPADPALLAAWGDVRTAADCLSGGVVSGTCPAPVNVLLRAPAVVR